MRWRGDGGRVGGVEEARARRPARSRPRSCSVIDPIEEPAPGDVVLDGLGEQVADVEHLDTAVAQRVGERVVLLAGPLDPQHVVEEQVGQLRRGEAAELEVRAVQQHPSQDARPRSRRGRRSWADRAPTPRASVGPMVPGRRDRSALRAGPGRGGRCGQPGDLARVTQEEKTMATTVHSRPSGTDPQPSHAKPAGAGRPSKLGLPSATALVIGSIIGTGVFTMPAVMAGAGTSSILTLAAIAIGALLLGVHVRPAHQAHPQQRGRPLRLRPPRVRRLRRLPHGLVLLDHLLGRQRRDRRLVGLLRRGAVRHRQPVGMGRTSASPSPACGSPPPSTSSASDRWPSSRTSPSC